jgi:hypothetical protein
MQEEPIHPSKKKKKKNPLTKTQRKTFKEN